MKPIGNRAILKVAIETKKDKEGNEYTDISREAKVIESNDPNIKKGAIVYYNPRGCINVETKQTKKDMVLIVDCEDIYAVQ
jgi:hypothetical protein